MLPGRPGTGGRGVEGGLPVQTAPASNIHPCPLYASQGTAVSVGFPGGLTVHEAGTCMCVRWGDGGVSPRRDSPAVFPPATSHMLAEVSGLGRQLPIRPQADASLPGQGRHEPPWCQAMPRRGASPELPGPRLSYRHTPATASDVPCNLCPSVIYFILTR